MLAGDADVDAGGDVVVGPAAEREYGGGAVVVLEDAEGEEVVDEYVVQKETLAMMTDLFILVQ